MRGTFGGMAASAVIPAGCVAMPGVGGVLSAAVMFIFFVQQSDAVGWPDAARVVVVALLLVMGAVPGVSRHVGPA
jgi:hypothetical protein